MRFSGWLAAQIFCQLALAIKKVASGISECLVDLQLPTG